MALTAVKPLVKGLNPTGPCGGPNQPSTKGLDGVGWAREQILYDRLQSGHLGRAPQGVVAVELRQACRPPVGQPVRRRFDDLSEWVQFVRMPAIYPQSDIGQSQLVARRHENRQALVDIVRDQMNRLMRKLAFEGGHLALR